MLLRYIKVLLSMSVALWGLIAGTMNLVYYSHSPVEAVMSVGGQESIRAITSPALIAMGYAFIYLGKLVTGALAAVGSYRLWISRRDTKLFHESKTYTVSACGFGMFMLFFSFYVAAGSFFSSGGINPLQDAFMAYAWYYIGALGVIALFIGSREFDT